MDRNRKKQLEDCVHRILEHGDMNKITESKVRKLAQEETGFNLSDPNNRKIVKRVVEDFFLNYYKEGTENANKAKAQRQTKVESRKPSLAKQSPPSKPERRRKLITLDDDEEEEAGRGNQYTRSNCTKEPEDEDDFRSKISRAESRNHLPQGRNQTKRGSSDVDESEKSDRAEASEEGAVRKSNNRVTMNKRRQGEEEEEEEEEEEKMNGRKSTVMPAKKRRCDEQMSDEAEEEEEEGEEERRPGSSKTKNPALVGNKQRPCVGHVDEDEEEEEAKRESQLRKRPEKKINEDSIVCQLSKTRSVAVQQFNGKTLVSIREYYEKEGKLLPTRKGISLTLEQWEAFKDGIPDIDTAIKSCRR